MVLISWLSCLLLLGSSAALQLVPVRMGLGNSRRSAIRLKKKLERDDKKTVAKGRLVVKPERSPHSSVSTADDPFEVKVVAQNQALLKFSNGTTFLVNTTELHQSQDRDLWLAVRASLELTASEFSAVLGKSFFTKRDVLLLRKLGKDPDPFTGNAATAWGLRCEPVAVDEYVEMSGCTVWETGLHVHSTDLGLGASPDGLVYDPAREADGLDPHGLLEVKCLFGRRSKKEIGIFDYCPKRFYDQIQGQLEVCNREFCDLFVWIPRNSKRPNARRIRVARNQEYWKETLEPALAAFRADLIEARSTYYDIGPDVKGSLDVFEMGGNNISP